MVQYKAIKLETAGARENSNILTIVGPMSPRMERSVHMHMKRVYQRWPPPGGSVVIMHRHLCYHFGSLSALKTAFFFYKGHHKVRND